MSFTGNRLDQDADEEEEEEDDDGDDYDAYDDEKEEEEDEDGDVKDCWNRCVYHHLTQSMAILDLFVATNSNNRMIIIMISSVRSSLRNHAPP